MNLLSNKSALAGIASAIFGIFILGWGIVETFSQHHKAQTYQAVDAVITLSEATERRGLKRTRYNAHVEFEYEVAGQKYTSENINSDVSTRPKSEAFVEKYPAGTKTTAYYDPANPAEAMLVRRYSAGPYNAILFGLLIIEISAWWARHELKKGTLPAAPLQQADGWYQLPLNSKINTSILRVFVRGGVWLGLITFCRSDYFSVSQESPGWEMLVLTIIYYTVGTICLLLGLLTTAVRLNFNDPEVFINQPIAEQGGTIRVRVQQPICKSGTMQKMRVTLKCTTTEVIRGESAKETKDKETVEFEKEYNALESYQAQAGENLEHEFEIDIPTAHPPTITAAENPDLFTRWTLHYHMLKTSLVMYGDNFVLHVKPETSAS